MLVFLELLGSRRCSRRITGDVLVCSARWLRAKSVAEVRSAVRPSRVSAALGGNLAQLPNSENTKRYPGIDAS